MDPNKVFRFDIYQIDPGKKRRSEDGALIVPGKLSKTGIQSYDTGDGSRTEYRPADEVFNEESMRSFDGIVVTDLHPDSGLVTPSKFRDLARGHIQNPRKDGEFVTADFYIHDRELIDLVELGQRTELSAGYFANLDFTPGEIDGISYDAIQRDIRGNHVATLPKGLARAGPEARLQLDSKGNQVFINDNQGINKEESKMDDFEVTINGIAYKFKADSSARSALLKSLEDSKSDLDKERSEKDKLQAKLDATAEDLNKTKEDLKTATDPARLDEMAKNRADFIGKAQLVGGENLDISGSDREIMIRALDSLKIKLTADHSDDYIQARFDAALETATTKRSDNDKKVSVIDAIQLHNKTNRKQVRFAKLRAARKAALNN